MFGDRDRDAVGAKLLLFADDVVGMGVGDEVVVLEDCDCCQAWPALLDIVRGFEDVVDGYEDVGFEAVVTCAFVVTAGLGADAPGDPGLELALNVGLECARKAARKLAKNGRLVVAML